MNEQTQFKTGLLTPERLKPIQQFLDDDQITDIDWNGQRLWVNTVANQSYMIDPNKTSVNKEYIENLTTHIANSCHKQFNTKEYVLEVESEEQHLRITAMHECFSVLGTGLCMRKTTTKPRYSFDDLIKRGYTTIRMLNLLINCMVAGCNTMICGIPEAGKTEFGKYLSLYIPDWQKVITIEDALEWYYSQLKPNANCLEWRVNPGKDGFDYSDAISLAMRSNPKRIILSEVRGKEVKELVELWHGGVPGIATIHTDDARKVPDRILNMMPTRLDAERLENNIYEDLDIGVLIDKRKDADGKVHRYLQQICFYIREGGENKVITYYENGKVVGELPEKIIRKLTHERITDPFEYDEKLRR